MTIISQISSAEIFEFKTLLDLRDCRKSFENNVYSAARSLIDGGPGSISYRRATR